MEYQNSTDWTWQVIFADGGTLDEYVNGVHTHAFASIQTEIDAGRQARYMILTPVEGRPDLRRSILALEPGQHPMFFRRARMPMPMFVPEGEEPEQPYTAHCLGLRRPGDGHESIVYLFHMPDGTTLLTANRNEF